MYACAVSLATQANRFNRAASFVKLTDKINKPIVRLNLNEIIGLLGLGKLSLFHEQASASVHARSGQDLSCALSFYAVNIVVIPATCPCAN